MTSKEKFLKGRETAKKHKTMDCKTAEFKIDFSHLSKADKTHLNMLFVEAKRLYNYLINDEVILYNGSIITDKEQILTIVKDSPLIYKCNGTKDKIAFYNKDRQYEIYTFQYLTSQMVQGVISVLKDNLKSLKELKSKGKKTGQLRFISEYKSIFLKQFNSTYKFGKCRIIENFYKVDKIVIQGLSKKPLRVKGDGRISSNAEIASGKLINRNGEYFIQATYYISATLENLNPMFPDTDVGIDFGIKNTLSLSNKIQLLVLIEETEKLKNLQRKLESLDRNYEEQALLSGEVPIKVKNKEDYYFPKSVLSRYRSKNYYRIKTMLNQEYQRIKALKDDITNKLILYLKQFKTINFQDENVSLWHKGLFGKQVQSSILGRLKSRLKKIDNIFMLDRYKATTKVCSKCGYVHKAIKLSDRIYKCPSCNNTEDRDYNAALNMVKMSHSKYNTTAEENQYRYLEKLLKNYEKHLKIQY